MKRCSKCKVDKNLDAFANNRAMRDGLNHYCKPCQKEHMRAYFSTEQGKAASLRSLKRSSLKFPEKLRARAKLNTAVRSGLIIKGECQYAHECEGRMEAHHDDYSKPLEVRWFCRKHHELEHHSVEVRS